MNNLELINLDSGNKSWLTPPSLITALGQFTLDPCIPEEGMPWSTATRMVKPSEDGLSFSWEGYRVWLNPPFGKIAIDFVKCFLFRRERRGIVLLPVRTDTTLFHELVLPHAHGFFFLRGRIRFFHSNGKAAKQSIGVSSMLVSFCEADNLALQKLPENGIAGAFLKGNPQ